MRLQDLERDAEIEVPRAVGGNIKQLARDPNYAIAWRFIIEDLCGRHRLSYRPGVDNPESLMIWLEGRRFPGEMLERIAAAEMPTETPAEPPARTMTERARRRATKS
jgi:hypothetical protein